MKHSITLFSIGSLLLCLISYSSVTAQIVPDKTLPTNSQVTPQGNTDLIEGGTIKGNNLFHSFEQFSITSGHTAYFNNSGNIQNIFTRVTGNSISNIDGILKANGIANFFLINPAGISFGKNSQLNIGGSFLASTANSIKFADGFEFKANGSQVNPLLSISIPTELVIGNNSGAIQANGTGQALEEEGILNSPTVTNSSNALQVMPGKTLALIGGEINLEGANLTAEGGQIELGSIASGIVNLNTIEQNWTIDYKDISDFKNINISKTTLINTSGNIGGFINLQGKNIFIADGSTLLVQNLGSQSWGGIKANASESLIISGTSSDGVFSSFLRTEALGLGSGGNIDIFAKNLILDGGGGIYSITYSPVKGGNINVDISKSIEIIGFAALNPNVTSGIIASTGYLGNTGDIDISTGKLLAQDGGSINTLTVGKGTAGNIVINGTDSIKVTNSRELPVPSNISSTTFNQGNAGNITINIPKLIVENEGLIDTSTRSFGNAGSLNINAFDIEISSRGAVNSSALKANQIMQQVFGAPPIPSGSPGELNINAERLNLTNNGRISITNEGTSINGGKLTINAGSISLNNESSIAASTASGEGGNIQLNVIDVFLNNKSEITASTDNQGNGGNININSVIISALKNSSITADAFEGRGGNIIINAQGLFLSSDSSITAKSEYGINGTVVYNINDPNIYPDQSKLQEISTQPQIFSTCQGQVGAGVSNFTVSTTRSLLSKPNDLVYNNFEQSNLVSFEEINNSSKESSQITEANNVSQDSEGNIILTTNQASSVPPNALSSGNSCFSVSQK